MKKMEKAKSTEKTEQVMTLLKLCPNCLQHKIVKRLTPKTLQKYGYKLYANAMVW